MSAFKGSTYWKEQCSLCVNRRCCKYRDSVELLLARLRVVELETSGCYGTMCFWCDYFAVDGEQAKEIRVCEVEDE